MRHIDRARAQISCPLSRLKHPYKTSQSRCGYTGSSADRKTQAALPTSEVIFLPPDRKFTILATRFAFSNMVCRERRSRYPVSSCWALKSLQATLIFSESPPTTTGVNSVGLIPRPVRLPRAEALETGQATLDFLTTIFFPAGWRDAEILDGLFGNVMIPCSLLAPRGRDFGAPINSLSASRNSTA